MKWWVPGDWNGFFGSVHERASERYRSDHALSLVVHLPSDAIVYGRILPALGIALPIGNLYYAYLAWRLAKQEGRERRDGDAVRPERAAHVHRRLRHHAADLSQELGTMGEGPAAMLAWQAGLAWAFIIGVIVLIGAFVGPTIRQFTPRAAMLGTLAGISITFISMRPAFQMWDVPWIAFVSLGIVLISWTANVRLPWRHSRRPRRRDRRHRHRLDRVPVRLDRYRAGREGRRRRSGSSACICRFRAVRSSRALRNIWPLLVTAIPLGVYNFTEGMNNVESASAAGDNYNLRNILLADGIGAIVGSMLGSPFPPAVYIGHPGWKAVGGRIGYSLATGVVIGLVCFLGLTALLLAVVPLVAILPILLYIGLVIGAQAFTASPAQHAPAVMLAIIPNIAAWTQNQVDGALGAAGTNAGKLGAEALGNNGVIYSGMALLGGGAVLAGLILGAIAAFIIDREFNKAAIYALAGAVLAFFGFIHGIQLQWMASPQVALGYVLLAVICYVVGVRVASETSSEPVGASKVAAQADK